MYGVKGAMIETAASLLCDANSAKSALWEEEEAANEDADEEEKEEDEFASW